MSQWLYEAGASPLFLVFKQPMCYNLQKRNDETNGSGTARIRLLRGHWLPFMDKGGKLPWAGEEKDRTTVSIWQRF